jgi:hypothetical protein
MESVALKPRWIVWPRDCSPYLKGEIIGDGLGAVCSLVPRQDFVLPQREKSHCNQDDHRQKNEDALPKKGRPWVLNARRHD